MAHLSFLRLLSLAFRQQLRDARARESRLSVPRYARPCPRRRDSGGVRPAGTGSARARARWDRRRHAAESVRLSDGDHNIDCKIDGFGAMALKSEFVKKA